MSSFLPQTQNGWIDDSGNSKFLNQDNILTTASHLFCSPNCSSATMYHNMVNGDINNNGNLQKQKVRKKLTSYEPTLLVPVTASTTNFCHFCHH
jgi:hypothetical protein